MCRSADVLWGTCAQALLPSRLTRTWLPSLPQLVETQVSTWDGRGQLQVSCLVQMTRLDPRSLLTAHPVHVRRAGSRDLDRTKATSRLGFAAEGPLQVGLKGFWGPASWDPSPFTLGSPSLGGGNPRPGYHEVPHCRERVERCPAPLSLLFALLPSAPSPAGVSSIFLSCPSPKAPFSLLFPRSFLRGHILPLFSVGGCPGRGLSVCGGTDGAWAAPATRYGPEHSSWARPQARPKGVPSGVGLERGPGKASCLGKAKGVEGRG